MRTFLTPILLLAAATSSFAAQAPATMRTIRTLQGLPRESLRVSVSRKFYKSLEISPVEAWIVARAVLMNSRAGSAKVIRSDANGVFDDMAVKLANSLAVSGLDYTESRIPLSQIDLHLLVYKIADGTMVVAFWHVDDSRYASYGQDSSAFIGILKDGKWIVIEPGKRRRR